MAELPVTASDALPEERVSLPGTDFLRGAVNMPAVRQVGMLFAIAAAVALAVAAVLWMQDEDLRPIAGINSPQQMSDVIQVLDANNIPYQIDHATSMLLVPHERLFEARMKLAGADAVASSQMGYELLDQDQGFGVSQFMENARHRRSVEGELARSIATIQGVHQARVLLAVPKSTTFIRDRRRPSASVTVVLSPGTSLERDQIRGITNLVAGAVPELDPADVAVVDQSGRLLSRQDDDAGLEISERQLSYVNRIETQLRGKLDRMLERLVGNGGYTAQVTAEVDFTREEQAIEQYAPAQTAVRSESTLEEERTGNLPIAGIPGALTNQPPADPAPGATADPAEAEANVPRTVRSEATRNFEVDRTLRYSQQSVGRLSRMAVSVVVDHRRTVDAESGETVTTPWSEEELQQLYNTVANAVGFNEARGDTLSVVSSAFHQPEEVVVEAAPFWSETWFIDLVQKILAGLALVLVVLGLLRPLFRTLSRAGEMVHERQAMAIADLNQAREQQAQYDALQELPAGSAPALGHDNAEVMKLDTVKGLVANDPERVAEVVKGWVATNE